MSTPPPGTPPPGTRRGPAARLHDAVAVYADRRMLLLFALGFSSGLPWLLVHNTLQFWLLDAEVTIADVTRFSAVAIPYSFKFLWAPLLDRVPLPWLARRMGQRRAWLLTLQTALVWAILSMALTDPATDPWATAGWAVLVSILSASQDVVIDAFRVDTLRLGEQGAGGAVAVGGYRLGMFVAGAGALYLSAGYEALGFADRWPMTYATLGLCGVVGIIATLFATEPAVERKLATGGPVGVMKDVGRSTIDAVFDLARRPGVLWFLSFVLLYKLGDALAGVMINPLLKHLAFSDLQIANIAKTFGLVATLVGVFAGGALVRGLGVVRALWVAGLLQLASNGVFTVQAMVGDSLAMLVVTIGVENLSGGLGTAAFVAYLSGLSTGRYSATQYAALTALSSFIRTGLAMYTGAVVNAVGYPAYFLITMVAAVPGLMILVVLQRRGISGLRRAEVEEKVADANDTSGTNDGGKP